MRTKGLALAALSRVEVVAEAVNFQSSSQRLMELGSEGPGSWRRWGPIRHSAAAGIGEQNKRPGLRAEAASSTT
eukprot:530458-Hanusia_phi.AAC.1